MSVLGHNSLLKYSLLNDESRELSNRIEEPDTKIGKKNWQKSKSTFPTFLGSAVLGGAVALFFLKKYSCRLFFFNIF